MDTLLEQLDERMRRVAEEVIRGDGNGRGATPAADLVDEQTRQLIAEQVLISHKTYLTRAEAAKYLQVSGKSIGDWSKRSAGENPFPERNAGGEPRYKRTDIDEWAEHERRRLTLKAVR
jgi:transposase